MNLPTKITFSRIIATVMLIITLFVLSFFDELYLPTLGNTKINLIFLIIFIFFVIASYTDHLDGHIARKYNMITNLGKFLDPVADKLLINSMLIFLAVPTLSNYNHEQTAYISAWCVIIMIIRDIVVDALRFIAAQKGVVIAANIFGKMKTVLQMVAIGAVLLNDFPFHYLYPNLTNPYLSVSSFLVYVATLVSFISGVIYVIQNMHALKEEQSTFMEVSNLLKEKQLTLGSVESFTGGSYASNITSIPGASKFFKGTCVTYATEVKNDLLGVSKDLIDACGVVSKEVAKEMAIKGKEALKVDICVSFTGNAGPEAMENKPVGEVYVAMAYLNQVEVFKYQLNGKRKEIQTQAMDLINQEILKKIK